MDVLSLDVSRLVNYSHVLSQKLPRDDTFAPFQVEAKRAVPREEKNPQAHQRTKKVFLGGLSPDTTKEDISAVLEQFGKVTDIQIMTEKDTGKPRGFGFAILDDFDDVDKLCIKKFHRIKVGRRWAIVHIRLSLRVCVVMNLFP